jgi:hypothetical protein
MPNQRTYMTDEQRSILDEFQKLSPEEQEQVRNTDYPASQMIIDIAKLAGRYGKKQAKSLVTPSDWMQGVKDTIPLPSDSILDATTKTVGLGMDVLPQAKLAQLASLLAGGGALGLTRRLKPLFKFKAPPTRAFHGTIARPFTKFDPTKARRTNKYTEFDRILGTHFAYDPNVSDTFTHATRGGHIIPVNMYTKKHYRVPQYLGPNGGLKWDSYAIAEDIANVVYAERPELFYKLATSEDFAIMWNGDVTRRLSLNEAKEMYNAIKDGSTTLRNRSGYYTLNRFGDVNVMWPYTQMSYPNKQQLVKAYKAILGKHGYDALEYINTASQETANAVNIRAVIPFRPNAQVESATAPAKGVGLARDKRPTRR